METNTANNKMGCPGMNCCNVLMNKMPVNAPKIIMPSSAMLITPERSLNIPPRATINNGMEKNIVCCTRK